jgi:CcmD family protein
MDVLVAAFASVWVAVALYVGWLDRNQRRLAARLEALSAASQSTDGEKSNLANAA